MKVGKPKSKRVPVRLRHKIEKASAAKQRKQRKLAKKNPEWRSRMKKDPGIPNLFPYKNQILQEIEENKRQKVIETERRKGNLDCRNPRVEKREGQVDRDHPCHDSDDLIDSVSDKDESMDDDSDPMAALLASARARALEYEHQISQDHTDTMEHEEDEWNGLSDSDNDDNIYVTSSARNDSSRKAFDKVFKQVVEAADVVLYVLDARDPEGTRSREVEQSVMSAEGGNKRLILILNKVDLVPPGVLKAWLVHFRKYFPTLPLRASHAAPNSATFDHKQLTIKSTSETLFNALKSFAQTKQLKRAISVGVVGYPNVGKSSVINALTSRLSGRSSACPTGAEAGVTTSIREVKVDSKLKLLDSPGIVFPNSAASTKAQKQEEQARLVLLNAVPPREIDDPVSAVALLLRRMSSSDEMFGRLLKVYDLPALVLTNGDVTMDFLIQVARKRGRLGKGGVPNVNSAAHTVITDWGNGRIQGWVEAPTSPSQAQGAPGTSMDPADALDDQKSVVTEWAPEFKLDGIWGHDRDEAEVMES